VAATAPEVRECAGPDCSRTFEIPASGYRAVNKRYCSPACQNRAVRLRGYRERRRYGVAGLRVNDDELAALRQRAIDELVLGALGGADGAHLSKVASVIVAADKRLARFD
jgi:hypothetical protein